MRKEVKTILKDKIQSDLSYKKKCDQKIHSHLRKLLRQFSIKSLGSFVSLTDEVNLEELSDSFPLVFPFSLSQGKMTFKSPPLKERKGFGIKMMEPLPETAEEFPNVVLVPGLAFTARGERLGRGAGFYDQYLEKNKCLKIGLCYSECLFPQIPVEEHDQQVDWVVTPEQAFDCSQERV